MITRKLSIEWITENVLQGHPSRSFYKENIFSCSASNLKMKYKNLQTCSHFLSFISFMALIYHSNVKNMHENLPSSPKNSTSNFLFLKLFLFSFNCINILDKADSGI